MEYAVRGPIVIRAGELERQLRSGQRPGNYDKIIRGNYHFCTMYILYLISVK